MSSCVISHVFTKYSPDLTRDLLQSPWLEPLWCHTDTNLPWGSSCSGMYLSWLPPKDGFAALGASKVRHIGSSHKNYNEVRALKTAMSPEIALFSHELLLCQWLSTILRSHFHCAQRSGGKWEMSLVNHWKRHIPDLTAASRICCCFLIYSITKVCKGCPQTGGFTYM